MLTAAPTDHLRGLDGWRATLRVHRVAGPPTALAFALSMSVLWLIDALWSTAPLDPPVVVYGACFALGFGALIGACVSTTFTLLAPLPAWARVVLWSAATIGASLGLVVRLGALARLSGQYSTTAWMVIGGACCAGLVMGLLLAFVHGATRRSARQPRAWQRVLITAVLLTIAAGAFYGDRVLYVSLYPEAHHALRAAALVMLGLGLLLWARPLRLRTLGLRDVLLLTVIASVPLWATLGADSYLFQGFAPRPWSLSLLRAARWVADVDRDGAAGVLAGGDCNDFNADIYPMAREIPDNGIDDNCIFGDAKRQADISENVPVPRDPSPLNVVLITVDTLTYNRIGTYDARYGALGRNTMPQLERWARQGTVFRQAYSAGGWTSISLAALMRGVYARKLRWERFLETTHFRLLPTTAEPKLGKGEEITKVFPLAWQDPHRPLASWLKRRGMYTHAVVDDGFSSMLNGSLGCREGFDHYNEVDHLADHRRNDGGTADMAISAYERARKRGSPFFLWVHFFGPHTPNETHRRVRVYGESMSDLYDHEVRYLDDELGRLLSVLRRTRNNTAVFVTADHGEAFGKGYRSHGFDLSEAMIRVPLIAHVPGWPAGTIEPAVSLVDLVPTILKLTATPAPAWLDGIDLSTLTTGGRPALRRALYTDTWQYSRAGEPFTDLVAALDGTHKVVLNRMDQTLDVVLQRGTPDVRPPVPPVAEHQLVTQLRAYLEETGGSLRLGP